MDLVKRLRSWSSETNSSVRESVEDAPTEMKKYDHSPQEAYHKLFTDIFELISTEFEFTNMLSILLEKWCKPINRLLETSNSPKLPKQVMQSTETLLPLHTQFLDSLKLLLSAAQENTRSRQLLKELLGACLILTSDKLADVYAQYALDYELWTGISHSNQLFVVPNYKQVVREVKQELINVQIDALSISCQLAEALENIISKGCPDKSSVLSPLYVEKLSNPVKQGKKVSINSLLTFPMTRLHQYKETFEGILKSLSVLEYEEELSLVQVLQRGVSAMGRKVHWHALGATREKELLAEIQSKVKGEEIPQLVSESRYLIREGLLGRQEKKYKRVLKPRRVFLFNDLLLWVSTKSLKPKGAIVLSKSMTISRSDSDLQSFSLVCGDKEDDSLHFLADTCPRAEEWITDIEQALQTLGDADVLQKKYRQMHKNLCKRRSVLVPSAGALTHSMTRDAVLKEREEYRKLREVQAINVLLGREVEKGISSPFNVKKHVGMNTDMEWQGEMKEEFKLTGKIGEGAFGQVFRAEARSGFVVAAKLVNIGSKELEEELRKEISILKSLTNTNIVSYFGCYGPDEEQRLWILMDYCELGSVADILQYVQLEEKEIAQILFKALLALVYLHSKHIVHRDVKANNILLTAQGEVKLCDFGVSGIEEDGGGKMVGTPYWMAPETMGGDEASSKADIWSLGITAIELAEGQAPHSELPPLRALRAVRFGDPPKLADSSLWSSDFVEFVEKCLVKSPQDRPDAIELLGHSFFLAHQETNISIETLARPIQLFETVDKTISVDQVEEDIEDEDQFAEEEDDVLTLMVTQRVEQDFGSVPTEAVVDEEDYSTIRIDDTGNGSGYQPAFMLQDFAKGMFPTVEKSSSAILSESQEAEEDSEDEIGFVSKYLDV